MTFSHHLTHIFSGAPLFTKKGSFQWILDSYMTLLVQPGNMLGVVNFRDGEKQISFVSSIEDRTVKFTNQTVKKEWEPLLVKMFVLF